MYFYGYKNSSHNVNDFINVDSNVYTDDDEFDVIINDKYDSDNKDNVENKNKVNGEENQLQTYKKALVYTKHLKTFAMNKCDSNLLETISRVKSMYFAP